MRCKTFIGWRERLLIESNVGQWAAAIIQSESVCLANGATSSRQSATSLVITTCSFGVAAGGTKPPYIMSRLSTMPSISDSARAIQPRADRLKDAWSEQHRQDGCPCRLGSNRGTRIDSDNIRTLSAIRRLCRLNSVVCLMPSFAARGTPPSRCACSGFQTSSI